MFKMGHLFTRQEHGVEDIDLPASSSYRYPSKTGCYFSSHFIMGGEKFKTVNPESFLFGDNADLNYLSTKPANFPYVPPSGSEPSKTLRSLVHMRKDTLRLVKVDKDGEHDSSSNEYRFEFTFDADLSCAVKIFLFCTESYPYSGAKYTSKKPGYMSDPVFYSKGANQVHKDIQFTVKPDTFNKDLFDYTSGASEIPIVIQISVEDDDFTGQSEVTIATFEKTPEGVYSVKPLKQKMIVDGLCYIIQEIYGIENKKEEGKDSEDDFEENGTECVICMCDTRDTLILPCRHLCLCNSCANSLKSQASTCPICRSPFHALLQVKVVRVKKKPVDSTRGVARDQKQSSGSRGDSDEYEEIPLVEALNGCIQQDGVSGFSSRPSSTRKARSRAGSRPGSRVSKCPSRQATREDSTSGPCADKVEGDGHERSASMSSLRSTEQGPHRESVSIGDGDPADPDIEDTNTIKINEPCTDLLASNASSALRELITDASMESDLREDQTSDSSTHIDLSLPGTPMGSENSTRSGSSMSGHRLLGGIYAGRGTNVTPSSVAIEENGC